MYTCHEVMIQYNNMINNRDFQNAQTPAGRPDVHSPFGEMTFDLKIAESNGAAACTSVILYDLFIITNILIFGFRPTTIRRREPISIYNNNNNITGPS